LAPISTVIQGLSPAVAQAQQTFPELTMIDPNLKNGYVHSYFAGLQQRITNDLTLEVNALGSYGRRLISTDVINRQFSTLAPSPSRYNNALPNINYRTGDAESDYNAMTAVVRYRAGRAYFQGSYTLSHTIDLQSDALVGDFFNLNFASIVSS